MWTAHAATHTEERLQVSNLGEEGKTAAPQKQHAKRNRKAEKSPPGGQGGHSHRRKPSHRNRGGAEGTNST